MGIGDTLSGYWKSAQPYLDPGNLLSGGPQRTDAGSVGGAHPEDQSVLQDVPGTNYRYDPRTGQYYLKGVTDPNTGQVFDSGATEVLAGPNLANQAAGATATQSLFLDQYNKAVANAAATRAGQNALAGNFNDVIMGRAPSVAETQLQTGMNRIGQDQNSQAAGANGQNAFGARRIAAQNTARASGDLSGQLALTRAAETAAARGGLASLYGQQSSADVAAQNIASGAGLGYANTAEKAEADRIGAQQRADEEYNKQRASVIKGAGDTLAGLFG